VSLLSALVVFLVGYLSGRLTKWFAELAAIAALLLAILGLAAPEPVFSVLDPVLAFYAGNELLFISGFLFGIAHDEYER
jgi:hypothetical protein